MKRLNLLNVGLVVIVLSVGIRGANINNGTDIPTTQPTTSQAPTTQPPTTRKHTTPPHNEPTTEPSVAEQCASRNASCDFCLKMSACLWCKNDSSCKAYPTGDVLPHSNLCSLDDARWGVCWVNFKVLIIVMGCLGGLIILGITICICCCCCCRKKNSSYDKDEAKYERRKMERKAKSDERRAERKAKTDEIRRKYGLIKEDNPYSRFDDA